MSERRERLELVHGDPLAGARVTAVIEPAGPVGGGDLIIGETVVAQGVVLGAGAGAGAVARGAGAGGRGGRGRGGGQQMVTSPRAGAGAHVMHRDRVVQADHRRHGAPGGSRKRHGPARLVSGPPPGQPDRGEPRREGPLGGGGRAGERHEQSVTTHRADLETVSAQLGDHERGGPRPWRRSGGRRRRPRDSDESGERPGRSPRR